MLGNIVDTGFVVLSPDHRCPERATPTHPDQNYANEEQTVRARNTYYTAPARHGENSTRQRIDETITKRLVENAILERKLDELLYR